MHFNWKFTAINIQASLIDWLRRAGFVYRYTLCRVHNRLTNSPSERTPLDVEPTTCKFSRWCSARKEYLRILVRFVQLEANLLSIIEQCLVKTQSKRSILFISVPLWMQSRQLVTQQILIVYALYLYSGACFAVVAEEYEFTARQLATYYGNLKDTREKLQMLKLTREITCR